MTRLKKLKQIPYINLKKTASLKTEASKSFGKKKTKFETVQSLLQRVSEFKLTKADIGAISAAAVIISVVSKLFYDSFLISLIFSPLIFVNILFQRKKRQREKKREIGMQFKDAIISVAAK